jgi:hypothetical protein
MNGWGRGAGRPARGASEFGQREWREGAAALVSYLRREESFRFLTGRSSPATIASMEVRSSVGRRAGDCLVAEVVVRNVSELTIALWQSGHATRPPCGKS